MATRSVAVVGQQRFLRRAALAAQHLPLRQRELARRRQLLLDERRQREIEVVAAEQQVLADRDALERQLVVLDAGANQAEVGRAAADVADQDQRRRRRSSRASCRRCAAIQA